MVWVSGTYKNHILERFLRQKPIKVYWVEKNTGICKRNVGHLASGACKAKLRFSSHLHTQTNYVCDQKPVKRTDQYIL